MPVTLNSKINSSDFNNIRTIIDGVMGVGSGTSGYGQTLKSSVKSANQLIDQTDWDNLRFDIVNARIHQTGAAFTANTNASNSADRAKLQFATASVGFLVLGMAVFGISPHPITTVKFIADIQTSGSNTIITLNSATESVVNSGISIAFGPGSVADFEEGFTVGIASINAYESLATTTTPLVDRFSVAAGQFATAAAASVERTYSAPQFWSNEISTELTVAFANANQARWFFNSGGEIRIASSRTLGRSDAQNDAWSSLLVSAGTTAFGGQIPTTGFSPMNGQNFYRLTNTYQNIVQLAATGYAANLYQIRTKCNVANNSSGTANIVYIQIRFIGGYVDPGPLGPPFTNDEIDGKWTVTATQKFAQGKLLPSGDFSVALPTYSFSSISGT
jgi:hypothetical protein